MFSENSALCGTEEGPPQDTIMLDHPEVVLTRTGRNEFLLLTCPSVYNLCYSNPCLLGQASLYFWSNLQSTYKGVCQDELCYTMVAKRLQVIMAQYNPSLAFSHGACLVLFSMDW